MDTRDHLMAQQLMRSFMQFKNLDWHDKTIAGCRPSEIKVLFCIKYQGQSNSPMKVSEISKHLHVTTPTVTQLINSLESNGLVERNIDPADRRVVLVALTEKGEKVTQRARDALYTSFNGLIEFLGEKQSEQLAELLTKVFTYFKVQSPWRGDDEV